MTLEEIAAHLESRYQDWGRFWRVQLDTVSSEPAVAARIVKFIEEAAQKPMVVGKPGLAVAQTLKLSSLANFRFGLLLGLMLQLDGEPPQLALDLGEQKRYPCLTCMDDGVICFQCYQPSRDCKCADGFDQVECPACRETGPER